MRQLFLMINMCKTNPLQSILILLKLIINTCSIKAWIRYFTSYWIFMHYSPFYFKYWLLLSLGITSQALPSTMQSQFTLLNRLELHIHWGQHSSFCVFFLLTDKRYDRFPQFKMNEMRGQPKNLQEFCLK